ncbi:MAG: hypothetical protein HFJ02_00605 [Bacilli bacterium]|nr:hypothetical protein [Bacilli bacterium]
MGINQPKKGSSLVWAHDLIHQLNVSGILARDIIKIISQLSKREIVLPTGKTAYLVDYNEFIKVAEAVTQKKVSNYVHDVNNFKKVVQKDIDKDKVIKDLRTLFYPIKQMNTYRESLYIEHECKESLKKAEEDKLELEKRKQAYSQPTFVDNRANYEEKNKIVLPSIEEILRTTVIPEPKIDNTIDYFDDDYIYDEEEIDKRFVIPHFEREKVADDPILLNEKKRFQLTPEMISSAWNRFEKRFLYFMGLVPLEELPQKKVKKKIEFKKFFQRFEKKEKELTLFESKLLDFLGLSYEEEEDNFIYEEAPSMIHQVENEKKEKLFQKNKNYRNEKKRNKDAKYQVYLLCQKLSSKKINDFSLNEKIEMVQASKKYIEILKKGENNLFDYEKEYALIIVNKIYNYLNSSLNNSTVYDGKLFSYMNSYIHDMKDYFEIETKPKIVDFKISKEMKNKIIKNISKVASLALVVVLGIGAKGMHAESDNKEVKGIEHEFTGLNIENTFSKLNYEMSNSVVENVNKSVKIENVTSERSITTQVLNHSNSIEENETDYFSIGESVQVLEDAKVYGQFLDLVDNENGQKPYYDSVELERTIRSVVVMNNDDVKNVYSNEEVDHYISLDYDVLGYQVDNMYSFDENGNYVCSEGAYNSQSLIRKLSK